jgi:hypothetical protein
MSAAIAAKVTNVGRDNFIGIISGAYYQAVACLSICARCVVPTTAPDALGFYHRRVPITDPDGFHDAVSGMSLTVDFRQRQAQPSRVEQLDAGMGA